MKTLLFIAHSPDFYGADKVLHQVVAAACERYRVHVLLPGHGEMSRRLNELPGVDYSLLPLPRFSLAAGDLAANLLTFVPFLHSFRRLLSRLRPDLVYGNTIRSAVPTAVACKFGYSTLMHYHECNVGGTTGRMLSSLVERAGQRNIFVCQAALDSYACFVPHLRTKSRVVYNGIEIVPVGTTDPATNDFADRRPRLLSVGQLAPHKRIGDLLEAMPDITAAFPEARLIVLGEGAQRKALEERRRELELEDAVFFPGYVRDVTPYLSAADLFLAPFEKEACNMAVIEAMAAGKPVVAAAGGGMPELVKDGETGFLHAPGAVKELIEKVLRLVRTPERQIRMSEASRQRAAEHFDLRHQMEHVLTEIEAATAENSGGV